MAGLLRCDGRSQCWIEITQPPGARSMHQVPKNSHTRPRRQHHGVSLKAPLPWRKVTSWELKNIFKTRNLFLKTPSKWLLLALFDTLIWAGSTRLWGAKRMRLG